MFDRIPFGRLWLASTMLLWLVPGTAFAQSPEVDPCDFTRDIVFSYDQVLECYQSVPWCSDPNDPVLCDRDAQVDVFRSTVEQFSTLRGNYDAMNGWRDSLEAIATAQFASDYDQYLAFRDLVQEFRNLHWVYVGPSCYHDIIAVGIPLDFGSTYTRTRWYRDPEQVIYLEAPIEGLVDYYLAVFGIDLRDYEGMRVVSIDGQDALDYFREWGPAVLREDADAGSNLMSILEFDTWSLRFGPLGDFPEAPSVTFELESRRGQRQTVELPWAFVPAALLGWGSPVPSSTEEFHASCFGQWPPAPTWVPESPWRGETVTVSSPSAGWLHWAVDGWETPPEEYWPEGTELIGPAVETPLSGPDQDGRFYVTLGPFTGPDVDVIDFVIHRADGTWDNNNGDDYHIEVAEEPPSGGAMAVFQQATDGRSLRDVAGRSGLPVAAVFDAMARRNLIDDVEGSDESGRGGRRYLFTEYYEVPDWQLDRDITEIVPLSDGARIVEYTDDTVAIQLQYDFVQPWLDELEQGVTYACENADRLIVDLRSNFGGYVGQGEWLAKYLNPEGAPAQNRWVYRNLALEPALNELRFWAEEFRRLYPVYFPNDPPLPPCWLTGFEASCNVSLDTLQPLLDPFWHLVGDFVELRGNDLERLTPLVGGISYIYYPPVPTLPCPGQFTGKDLIILVNGQNASMGFITAEWLREIGTLVSAGGFFDEPMVTGQARGGNVFETSHYVEEQDYIASVVALFLPEYAGATRYDVFQHPLPELERGVVITMEERAWYTPDLETLFVDEPRVADVQIPFWSNTDETDGAAYRMTVSHVERQAVIEPACGEPDDYRFCFSYNRCARRAMDDAVDAGETTEATAHRVLIDAAADCWLRR